MNLWQASLFLAVLGVFTIAFLASIAIIGLKTDKTGGEIPVTEEPTAEGGEPNAEGEESADDTALRLSVGGVEYMFELAA